MIVFLVTILVLGISILEASLILLVALLAFRYVRLPITPNEFIVNCFFFQETTNTWFALQRPTVNTELYLVYNLLLKCLVVLWNLSASHWKSAYTLKKIWSNGGKWSRLMCVCSGSWSRWRFRSSATSSALKTLSRSSSSPSLASSSLSRSSFLALPEKNSNNSFY